LSFFTFTLPYPKNEVEEERVTLHFRGGCVGGDRRGSDTDTLNMSPLTITTTTSNQCFTSSSDLSSYLFFVTTRRLEVDKKQRDNNIIIENIQ
jgi:hypothetical protein